MKNITLSVDDQVLVAVRRYAAERDTSVNALVREHLTRIADHVDRAAHSRARIRELSEKSTARIGVMDWNRDDLHKR
jgi:hypothetical protein